MKECWLNLLMCHKLILNLESKVQKWDVQEDIIKKHCKTLHISSILIRIKKKAKEMLNEESVEKLEQEIREQRNNVDAIDFIFDAGIVAGIVLECADRDDGCDGFNACLGGISEFEEFVKGL